MKSRTEAALRDAQDANMRALLTTQKAAAATFQDVFETQVEAISATLEGMSPAENMDASELAKAYERAVAAFQDLEAAGADAQKEVLERLRTQLDASKTD